MTLRLSRTLERQIREHSSQAYNEEACGVLIGSEDRSKGNDAESVMVDVVKVRPLENTKQEERQRRYLIDPQVFIKLEKELEHDAWDLVGIYHSHPDHPARPSQFDHDHALPGLSYVIINVEEGSPGAFTSWRLSDDRKKFLEEPIVFAEHHDGNQ